MNEITCITNANRDFLRHLQLHDLDLPAEHFVALADYIDDQRSICLHGSADNRADAVGRLREIDDLVCARDLEDLARLARRIDAPGSGLAPCAEKNGYLLEEVLSRRAVVEADEWLAALKTPENPEARSFKITILGPGRRVFRFSRMGRPLGFVMAFNQELMVTELDRRSKGVHKRPITRLDWEMTVLGMSADASDSDRAELLRMLHQKHLDANGCAVALGVLIDAFGTTHKFDCLPDALVIHGDIRFPAGVHPPLSLVCSGDVRLFGIEGITIRDTLRCAYLALNDCADVVIESTGCTHLILSECESIVMPNRLSLASVFLEDCHSVMLPDHFIGDLRIDGGEYDNMSIVQGSLSIEKADLPDGVTITRNLKATDVRQIGADVTVGGSLLIETDSDVRLGSDLIVEGNLTIETAGVASIGPSTRVMGATSILSGGAVIAEACIFFDDIDVETDDTMPIVSEDIVTLATVDIGMIAEAGPELESLMADALRDVPEGTTRH